ncbi:hypothetical protein FIU28_16790 [Tardiphaga sp. vice154]|uniref:hypothetical protein n=1 Tax=Tardiphaga sp. vice154 TaxID=2592814 RepID=UPI00116251FD|nr:hypothetical protein [Tardiphaga sp. vice154]QDM22624.1 hypothetical protein FIU28_16790 [Tardiphaga sp. vice154]
MDETAQRKTIDLPAGLFLMRYNSADDSKFPPVVRITPDRSSVGSCEILVGPDATEGTLWSPDSSLVVYAAQPAKLTVAVSAQRPGGSTAANLKFEPLTQGTPPAPQFQSSGPMISSGSAAVDDVRILAHVAGIGDLSERANAWIAGPMAPARIEGFCLYWPNKPYDIDINYAVKFARPQRGDGQMVPLGTYAGTRGRALPLTGVTMQLSGPAASHYMLTAEAIFLGAPALRVTGQSIKLAGPSGREPLVGIKLNIEPLVSQAPAPLPAPAATVAAPVQRTAGRVRVFRSRQNVAKPAG